MTVLSERWHTARKRHTCDSCMRSIEPGQRYYSQANLMDGFGIYRSHEDCDTASRIVYSYWPPHYGDDGLPRVCDMEQEDRETVHADAPEVAARLWPSEFGPAA